MVPSRSSQSKFAKHIFYQEINSINIFIEDTEKGIKKIFIELIQKSLTEHTIKEIFPLGGRLSVLTKHKEYVEKKYDSKGNNIFIVDGDLYLLNQSVINAKGLLGLNKYCIENYFIDEDAIIEFLYYADHEKSREKIKNKLSFNEWCNHNILLLYLFVLYSISHNQKCGIPTISYNVKSLIKNDSGIVDKKTTITKIIEFKKELTLKIGLTKYKELRNQILKNIIFNKNSLLSYVSGKDYLMPLLIFKMKQVTKFNYKNEILKLNLAKNCNSSYFEKIVDIMI